MAMPKLILAAAATLALSAFAAADVKDRIYDFTDTYYSKNGVDSSLIFSRVNGADGRSVLSAPNFSFQRNVRMIRHNPAYDQSGNPVFWSVMGDINVAGFAADSAGRKAKEIADSMPLYVFPGKNATSPTALNANRQADVADMRHGYFSNNPLGLWLHIWITYTPAALNTANGKKTLADLAKKNGVDLDGTPIIKTTGDIDDLLKKGYIARRFRAWDGSEGPMYGICPVIKDPRKGGIAVDASLSYVKKPDGSPLEAFLSKFTSLQTTGDWPR
jgi:hypothetical protein